MLNLMPSSLDKPVVGVRKISSALKDFVSDGITIM